MAKFIAEVSSNHARDIERSLRFIDHAADAGCDAVKFQLFRVEQLFSPEVFQYIENPRPQKGWELPLEFLPELAEHCKKRGVEFSCTPFYLAAVEELLPYVDFYKIASYELLWDDLLAACAQTAKPVVLSTGMATIDEVLHAVEVLKKNGCADLTLLHCTSAYPTPYLDANLKAIETLRNATGHAVGWSDHTVESAVIYRAIFGWGAPVIEFHLDIDGYGEEFQTGHCWLPEQIAQVISEVKKGFEADGSGVKEPVASELPDRQWRADPVDGLRPLRSIRNSLK